MKKIKSFILSIKFFLKNFVINAQLNNEYINSKKKNNVKSNKKYFYILIDLMSFRATWDIIIFLIYSFTKVKKYKPCIIVIPQNKIAYDPFPPKEKSWLNKISKEIRLDNIIKPSLEIIDNFQPKIIYLDDRNELDSYIKNTKYYFPEYAKVGKIIEWKDNTKNIHKFYYKNKYIPRLKSPHHYKVFVEKYIKANKIKKKIVTITLRDSTFNKSKNSNIKNWKKFYLYLTKKNYYPIVLYDFETIAIKEDKKNKFNNFLYANIDVRLRLALYEKAYLNLGVSSGPMSLLTYSKNSNFIIYKHADKNSLSSSSFKANKASNGLDPNINEQYPFYSKTQRIVWDTNDNFEILKKHFLEIEKILNKG
jgi:hypothetical protein